MQDAEYRQSTGGYLAASIVSLGSVVEMTLGSQWNDTTDKKKYYW